MPSDRAEQPIEKEDEKEPQPDFGDVLGDRDQATKRLPILEKDNSLSLSEILFGDKRNSPKELKDGDKVRLTENDGATSSVITNKPNEVQPKKNPGDAQLPVVGIVNGGYDAKDKRNDSIMKTADAVRDSVYKVGAGIAGALAAAFSGIGAGNTVGKIREWITDAPAKK